MKVKIVRSYRSSDAWYGDKLFEVFEVYPLSGSYYQITDGDYFIHRNDAKIIEEVIQQPQKTNYFLEQSLEILQAALKDLEDDISLQIRGGNVVVKHNDKLYVIEPSEASELLELLRKLKAFEVTV